MLKTLLGIIFQHFFGGVERELCHTRHDLKGFSIQKVAADNFFCFDNSVADDDLTHARLPNKDFRKRLHLMTRFRLEFFSTKNLIMIVANAHHNQHRTRSFLLQTVGCEKEDENDKFPKIYWHFLRNVKADQGSYTDDDTN